MDTFLKRKRFFLLHSCSPYLQNSLKKNLLPPVNTHRLNRVCKTRLSTLDARSWVFESRRFDPCRAERLSLLYDTPHMQGSSALPCSAHLHSPRLTRKGRPDGHLWRFLNNLSKRQYFISESEWSLFTLFLTERREGGLWSNCCLIELVSFSWQDTLFKLGSAYKPFSDPFV